MWVSVVCFAFVNIWGNAHFMRSFITHANTHLQRHRDNAIDLCRVHVACQYSNEYHSTMRQTSALSLLHVGWFWGCAPLWGLRPARLFWSRLKRLAQNIIRFLFFCWMSHFAKSIASSVPSPCWERKKLGFTLHFIHILWSRISRSSPES